MSWYLQSLAICLYVQQLVHAKIKMPVLWYKLPWGLFLESNFVHILLITFSNANFYEIFCILFQIYHIFYMYFQTPCLLFCYFLSGEHCTMTLFIWSDKCCDSHSVWDMWWDITNQWAVNQKTKKYGSPVWLALITAKRTRNSHSI